MDKEPACNTGDTGDWVRSLGPEDPLEEANGNPLQYSCLKNPMDRGVWQASVQRVSLSDMTERLHTCIKKI